MVANSIMDELGSYAPFLVLLFLIVAFVSRMLYTPSDPREPPLVKSNIPFIGHIIGIFRHKMEYFELLK